MKRNIFYVITTILLLLLIIFFSRETVYAQREGRIAVDSEVQKQIEKEHVEAVKDILSEHNLSNSGVMMTKVIYGDGKREYTVKINNRLIQTMTPYDCRHQGLQGCRRTYSGRWGQQGCTGV